MVVLQADTIQQHEGTVPVKEQTAAVGHQAKPTPWKLLKMLPKDATPAQQDSIIQANIKPGPVHWSQMPDTLHLPGHKPAKSWRQVTLPQYYRESFFSKDSLYHPELRGGRLGVVGDPVPYTVAGDNFITSLLVFCFVLACVSYGASRQFIWRQMRQFFYVPHFGTTEVTETGNEMRVQLFLVLQTCLLIAIGYFLYSRVSVSDTFTVDLYVVISLYAALLVGYFLLKALLYTIVGWVFFARKVNRQWMKSYLFLVSSEGVVLFPAIVLLTYFGLSLQSVVVYALIVVGIIKILTFYKTYIVFFRRKGGFVQNILYFCTLEAVPFAGLLGGLMLMTEYLKINF